MQLIFLRCKRSAPKLSVHVLLSRKQLNYFAAITLKFLLQTDVLYSGLTD